MRLFYPSRNPGRFPLLRLRLKVVSVNAVFYIAPEQGPVHCLAYDLPASNLPQGFCRHLNYRVGIGSLARRVLRLHCKNPTCACSPLLLCTVWVNSLALFLGTAAILPRRWKTSRDPVPSQERPGRILFTIQVNSAPEAETAR